MWAIILTWSTLPKIFFITTWTVEHLITLCSPWDRKLSGLLQCIFIYCSCPSNVVNTWGALFYPMPCGSMHLPSDGSAVPQDMPRFLCWTFCFQLAKRERGRLREYQGQHFCTFPFARILSQGPNLLVKEVWTWSVPLHPGRQNSIGDTQTVCHALHSYKHNSADLECLPIGPRQHTQDSRKRQAAGHVGLDLNLSLIFAC